MGKKDLIERLRNDDEVEFDRDRFDFLTEDKDIYYRRAAALMLAEHGWSHTGIARKLDVTPATAKGYLDDLTDSFGDRATISQPQNDPVEELWPSEPPHS